jgi:ATP-dependent helicase/nuclease subunit A
MNEFIKLLQRRRRECEQVRLLYVAATRARRELHWLGALPGAEKTAPHRGTLLGVLWRVIGAEFLREPTDVAAAAHVADPAAAPRAAWPLQRLSAAWRAPQVEPGPHFVGLNVASYEPSTQPQYDWVGQTSRHVGTLVHQILERLARTPPLPASGFAARAREHYRARLAALGVAAEELDDAAARVAQAVDALLADERGRWILCAEQREAVSELALTGVVDGRLTSVAIDRSFIDAAGVRWVIDFKTSSHAGAGLEEFLAAELERYRPQLRRYAALARRLGPQPVRAALYFPLLRAFRESELA